MIPLSSQATINKIISIQQMERMQLQQDSLCKAMELPNLICTWTQSCLGSSDLIKLKMSLSIKTTLIETNLERVKYPLS